MGNKEKNHPQNLLEELTLGGGGGGGLIPCLRFMHMQGCQKKK